MSRVSTRVRESEYDVAIAVFGHGLDLSIYPDISARQFGGTTANYQAETVPNGFCWVTGMIPGESANVWGHVDRLFNLFKDPQYARLFLNPETNADSLRQTFPQDTEQQVHIHPERTNVNKFSITPFLAGENDENAGHWVVKSGIYQFPIPADERFTVKAQDADPNELLTGRKIRQIYSSSLYPTVADFVDETGADETKIGLIGTVEYDAFNERADASFTLTNESIYAFCGRQFPGQRVVIYNFTCREDPAEYLGMVLTRSRLAAAVAIRIRQGQDQIALFGKDSSEGIPLNEFGRYDPQELDNITGDAAPAARRRRLAANKLIREQGVSPDSTVEGIQKGKNGRWFTKLCMIATGICSLVAIGVGVVLSRRPGASLHLLGGKTRHRNPKGKKGKKGKKFRKTRKN